MTKGGHVYIMANRYRGTIYIGVTADLPARIFQHRTGDGSDFCKRYGLDRLVYAEPHDNIGNAIAREKAL
jgi:putative endonuclease